jgi:uracil-DNA glycosylase
MSDLPESVLRWARYQRELGLDEFALDTPLSLRDASTSTTKIQSKSLPPPRTSAVKTSTPTFDRPPPRPAGASPKQASAPAPRPSAPATPARTAIPTFANVLDLCTHAGTCQRCVLHGRRRSVLATGGPDRSTWAVLTLYAWGEDAQLGGILSGEYAKPLMELARSTGLPEPAVAAIFACTPDDPSDSTIQGFTEAVRCRGHWMQRLRLSGARAVLVLDHKATSLARGPSVSVEWPAFRGQVWDLDGLPAISTHHPSRLARQEALKPDVDADLRRILALIGTT